MYTYTFTYLCECFFGAISSLLIMKHLLAHVSPKSSCLHLFTEKKIQIEHNPKSTRNNVLWTHIHIPSGSFLLVKLWKLQIAIMWWRSTKQATPATFLIFLAQATYILDLNFVLNYAFLPDHIVEPWSIVCDLWFSVYCITHKHTCTHKHKHTYKHIRIYARTHACTHTHKPWMCISQQMTI